jgi:Domain of unknown function (DUF4148)
MLFLIGFRHNAFQQHILYLNPSRSTTMKTRQFVIALAAALTFPIVAHAQDSGSTVTRAQVRAQLVQLEKAGYQPSRRDQFYPDDIQAAEAKIVSQGGDVTASVGGAPAGTSVSGNSVSNKVSFDSIYAHH